jgi:methylated-DNA-[protein]-cysteine S-methyltransferase
MKSTHFTQMNSPIGTISLCGTEFGLAGIFMENHRHGPEEARRHGWQLDDVLFAEARAQLEEYFDGRRTVFSISIDREAIGGTSFQRRVWKALEEIPYGVTISYGELARRINQPTAVRAVGLANGRNPLSIIVPCHRVIGSDGKLTGYGGGMDRKRWLLDLESNAVLNFEFREEPESHVRQCANG